MFSRLLKYLETRERAWRHSFGHDLSTPAKRRQAMIHFNWIDHGILRKFWTNFYEVAPGVYRSNQPSPERLKRYKAKGIKSVINLRGTSPFNHYLLEQESCETLGLTLASLHFSATNLPQRETLLALEEHFKTLEHPIVMHCKSGSDRAGFASALYLMMIKGASVEEASRQLALKYLHVKNSKAGILDYFLESYRKSDKASPITISDWIRTEYDRDAMISAYKAYRKGKQG